MRKVTKIEDTDGLIDSLLKSIPLRTRIRIILYQEWLIMNTDSHKYLTDENSDKASKWANDVTGKIIEAIDEWKLNGSPTPIL